ncbi:hypothetical protein LAD77_01670 [Klebsiella pneumoniae]|nr:hypothetical protein [Klebsiella pneumoniae]
MLGMIRLRAVAMVAGMRGSFFQFFFLEGFQRHGHPSGLSLLRLPDPDRHQVVFEELFGSSLFLLFGLAR